MALKRIIIDTQSNALFRGSALQQNYDQRGGLCQVGAGHAVVTTHAVDADYLRYWQSIGFSLPRLIAAGPFSSHHTLSELILNNPRVQDEIRDFIGPDAARLEFFYIEKSEQLLSGVLGVPAYCNFELSLRLSRKLNFKALCRQLALPTAAWEHDEDVDRMLATCEKWLNAGTSLLIKSNDGTGGIPCGSMFKVGNVSELPEAARRIRSPDNVFFLEAFIDSPATVASMHWEIDDNRNILPVGLFEHVTQDDAQIGITHPLDVDPAAQAELWSLLQTRLGPYLIRENGRGFFQCDIIIDRGGNAFWIDFNPRKGGGLYVGDMVRRLSKNCLNAVDCCFVNEHVKISRNRRGPTFKNLFSTLKDLLDPGTHPFVVVTNPGVLPFGRIDLTGISAQSRQAARGVLEKAKARLT